MYIVNNYTLAVIFCVVTMICWGSWGNTQKLAAKTWRYEYFYWDYVIGLLLFSILSAFTLGSVGSEGRSFLPDLAQADWSNIGSALLGGVVFNAANILLAAAIAICGLSVAFPVGIGLALVLGVLVNYFGAAKGAPLFIFIGVALIVVAIVLNGLAYRKMLTGSKKVPAKGIGISIAAGVIMAFFYRFVAASMEPISIGGYFRGSAKTHLVGILGGVIWCVGQSFSMIASEQAGAAISYGLGQGATLVSAMWGILVWKEFKGAPKASDRLNAWMFVLFIVGLGFLIYAGA